MEKIHLKGYRKITECKGLWEFTKSQTRLFVSLYSLVLKSSIQRLQNPTTSTISLPNCPHSIFSFFLFLYVAQASLIIYDLHLSFFGTEPNPIFSVTST